MLRRAIIAFAAWQARLNDRLATLGKSTSVEKSTQVSKACALPGFACSEHLLRRVLTAGLLRRDVNSLSRTASLKDSKN